MTKSLNEVLDAEFEEFPVLVAGPARQSDFEMIEKFAGFPLPSSYRDFVLRYGGAIVGPYSIFGWGSSSAMGVNEDSAIDVTNRYRSDRWPGSDGALVVSMDHAGNAIMMRQDGAVVRFDHDSGDTEILARNFESFILGWCLKTVVPG